MRQETRQPAGEEDFEDGEVRLANVRLARGVGVQRGGGVGGGNVGM